jgi:hypothetical protein
MKKSFLVLTLLVVLSIPNLWAQNTNIHISTALFQIDKKSYIAEDTEQYVEEVGSPVITIGFIHELNSSVTLYAEAKKMRNTTETATMKVPKGSIWSSIGDIYSLSQGQSISGGSNRQELFKYTTKTSSIAACAGVRYNLSHNRKWKHHLDLGLGFRTYMRNMTKRPFSSDSNPIHTSESSEETLLNAEVCYVNELTLSQKASVITKLGISTTPIQMGLSFNIH